MKEYEDDIRFYDEFNASIGKKNAEDVMKFSHSISSKGYVPQNMAPLFGPDSYEEQFPYQDAAKLYLFSTMNMPKDPDAVEYENQKIVYALAKKQDFKFENFEEEYGYAFNEKGKELVNDPCFRRYVRDYCISHNNHAKEAFDANEFAKGYDDNLKKQAEATKAWSNLISESDEFSAKNTVEATVKSAVNDIDNGFLHGESVSPTKNVKPAVDYIVAKSILGKAADATFFQGLHTKESYEYNMKTGQNDIHRVLYSDNDMKVRIDQMRKQILEDPLFKETISQEGMKLENVYDAYKTKVNQRINDKIHQNEKQHDKLLKDKFYYQKLSGFAKKVDKALSEEEMNNLKDLYNGLKEFNKGKDPSDEMKALTDALDNMIDNPNGINLINLNNAALKYYDKRQGTFFSPFTDKGKARLGTVEKMISITSPKTDKLNKDFAKEQQPEKAVNAKPTRTMNK